MYSLTTATHVHPTDLLGVGRLYVDATSGMLNVVEDVHRAIARTCTFGTPAHKLITCPAGLAYSALRAVTRLLGKGIEALAGPLIPILGEREALPKREIVVAAVNGILGDYLAATGNPLATRMCLRRCGRPLRLEREALAAVLPRRRGKLLLMVHGLCRNDLHWTRGGHNHGVALEEELGWTTIHLNYNSGLHVSTNGRAFADLLEALIRQWPGRLRELAILAHSSGGLVSRSAYYYGVAAGHRWPRYLRRMVFLGTPHQGAALERGGNWVNALLGLNPFTAPLARIANVRSAGVTDLRYGNVLDEDWEGIDRFRHMGDPRHPVPLPKGVRCFAIAGSADPNGGGLARPRGDGLVSVNSALGRHTDPGRTLAFPKSRQWVGYGLRHWELLRDPEVYQRIRTWLAAAAPRPDRPTLSGRRIAPASRRGLCVPGAATPRGGG